MEYLNLTTGYTWITTYNKRTVYSTLEVKNFGNHKRPISDKPKPKGEGRHLCLR